MPIDHEKFNNILSGVQSAVVALAVVVGGVWTLYTFDILEHADKAKAELQEFQSKLKEQAVIEIDIASSQITIPNESGRFISAIVTVHNKGNRNVLFEFDDHVFTATPVSFSDNNELKFGSWVSSRVYDLPPFKPDPVVDSSVLRAKASMTIHFIVKAEGAGLYLLGFRSNISAVEEQITRELVDRKPGQSISWTAKKFFTVK